MESELHDVVTESVRMMIYPNAIFHAERLFSAYPYLPNLYTMAKVYFDSGDAGTCYRLLKSYAPFQSVLQHPMHDGRATETVRRQLMYLLGVACVKHNRIQDAERVLQELVPSSDGAAEYWLGVCKQRHEQQAGPAAQYFTESFRRNAHLFVSFEECVKIKPVQSGSGNFYSDLLEDLECAARAAATTHSGSVSEPAATSEAPTSSTDTACTSTHRSNSRFFAPPPPRGIPHGGSTTLAPAAAGKKAGQRSGGTSPPKVPAGRGPASPTKAAGGASFSSSSPKSQLVQLHAQFGEALLLHHSYQCAEAVRFLTSDMFPEQDSGWQLGLLALTYFHNGAMQEARHAFQRMRLLEPWRLQDPSLVFFSTTLWHLKDEHGLGLLAQQLMEDIPMDPITMCVAGNSYSLARDSRMAIQMLKRATTVDRNFAYGFTLYGYELLAADEKNEALAAFNQAVASDPRHYIAYAGIGEVAFRLDNSAKAQHYFMQATNINRLPAIVNRLASTYHRRGATVDSLRKALELYQQSLQRNPTNVPARHQRAEVLMKLRRHEEALQELERLRSDCPDEAMVYASLGRCAHKMGRVAAANQYYHKALDMDPRRSGIVKNYLERLQQNLPADDDE